MTSIQPKTKISDIASRVASIALCHNATDFEVASIKRDINKLIESDKSILAIGHMCLGLLEYFSGNFDRAIDFITNARRLDAKDEFIFVNSLAFYSDLALYDDMLTLSECTEAKFNYSKSALKVAFKVSLEIFQLSKASTFLALYRKIDLDADNSIPSRAMEMFMSVEQLFLSGEVSEQHILQLLKSAANSVKEAGKKVISTDTQLIAPREFISYLYIDADSHECASINFDIADTLVSNFEDSGMRYLSILCRPIEHRKSTSLEGIK